MFNTYTQNWQLYKGWPIYVHVNAHVDIFGNKQGWVAVNMASVNNRRFAIMGRAPVKT